MTKEKPFVTKKVSNLEIYDAIQAAHKDIKDLRDHQISHDEADKVAFKDIGKRLDDVDKDISGKEKVMWGALTIITVVGTSLFGWLFNYLFNK